MKNLVCTIHGYDIHVSPFSGTYWIWYEDLDTGKTINKEWKTLNGAIKWCENH